METISPPVSPIVSIFMSPKNLAIALTDEPMLWLAVQLFLLPFTLWTFCLTKFYTKLKTGWFSGGHAWEYVIVIAMVVWLIMLLVRAWNPSFGFFRKIVSKWYIQAMASSAFLISAFILEDPKIWERSEPSLYFFILASFSITAYIESFDSNGTVGFFTSTCGFAMGIKYDLQRHHWFSWLLLFILVCLIFFKFYCMHLRSKKLLRESEQILPR